MIINHNMPAISASRILTNNDGQGKSIMEKLASGKRINRSSDDAAGLAVAEKLTTQIRGLTQASRNASHAIGFIQTTEGHLTELNNVLQRMRELAIQTANGTYSDEDRAGVQVEVEQLTDEINRIAEQAQYNKMHMLSPSSAEGNAVGAEQLGMNPAKINTPESLAEAQVSWTLRVHVGANTDEAVAANIYASDVASLFVGENAGDGQGSPMNVRTAVESNTSISRIDDALRIVNDQRANLGAFQARLESVIRGADYAVENLTDAESRIRDANMATEMVNMTRNNILNEAGISVLAQANVRPQGILNLLR